MKDTKFPPIDDILANNIEPEPAITTAEKEQQIATPAKEANPETVTQMLKRRAALQPRRFTQSDPKIAIDRVIIDTINLCDFGHLTPGRVINAMLVDFIETHQEELKGLSRKTLI